MKCNLHQMEYIVYYILQNYFAIVNKLKGSPDQGKIEFGCIQKKTDNQAISYNVEITKSTNHFYMSHA